MSTYNAVSIAINNFRINGKKPSVYLDRNYENLDFTNFDMSDSSVGDRAVFSTPAGSGVIDLGRPFGYRFLVFKKVDEKKRVSYQIVTGCRRFSREDALKHPNWNFNTKQYRRRVREEGHWAKRVGIKELLATVDQLAKCHWGYKIPR